MQAKNSSAMKTRFRRLVRDIQDRICVELEGIDGVARFEEDLWDRPGGGGGITRIIRNGAVFEKGGVNTSEVYGELPESMQNQFGVSQGRFYATGVSLVIHPLNPMVPAVHLNYRYFELYDDLGNMQDVWFGGGADLTPYYLFEEDAVAFHEAHKEACDAIDPAFYGRFKVNCDEYFVNAHRNENRGIGGIFYDYMRIGAHSTDDYFHLARGCANAFLKVYPAIVNRRKGMPYTEENRDWQEIRRGRYVEFNLVHDRGTTFGLKTGGRTESILMSLPPRARWDYDHHPEKGSKEEALVRALQPRDWINLKLK